MRNMLLDGLGFGAAIIAIGSLLIVTAQNFGAEGVIAVVLGTAVICGVAVLLARANSR